MEYLLTREQMQHLDNYTIENIGVLSAVLMERAAMAVVKELELKINNGVSADNILIVCGNGNNGGDAIAVGRIMHLREFNVRIVFIGSEEKAAEETKRQLTIARNYGIKINSTFDDGEYTIIIDGIFGIGLTRNIEGRYKDAILYINKRKAYKVSIDIPSGVNSDDGSIMGAGINADLTVAIAYKKLGHILYPGSEYCNETVVKDIGVLGAERLNPCFSYSDRDLSLLPKRKAYSNKGTYGKALVIAGSADMCGAAYLAAISAYRMGAGIVKIYTPAENRSILLQLIPEAIIITYDPQGPDLYRLESEIKWADAIDIGPGMGLSDSAYEILKTVINTALVPVVIDADGLNITARHKELLDKESGNVIITPHLKEMSRLTGYEVDYISQNLVGVCKRYSEEKGIVCVLKDARTIVADFEKRVYINQSGNNGMATAGSGDVLSGIILGLLAQGMPAFDAAALSVYIHGRAGDYAKDNINEYSMTARDISENIQTALSGGK